MELTHQNIYERTVAHLNSKPDVCSKILELLESGTLVPKKKSDDFVTLFGPWLQLQLYLQIEQSALMDVCCRLL